MNQLTFLCCCYSQFWTNFWPNFASTLFGLLLGLPLALWTNRIITSLQDRQNQKDKSQRLNNALQIIKATLTENQTRLSITVSALNNGEVQLDTQLDVSAWDAVKDDLSEYLHDPDLKKRIAYHFSRLNTMSKLNSMYLDLSVGIGSALTGNEQTKLALKNNLLRTASFLMVDNLDVRGLIEKVLQKQ